MFVLIMMLYGNPVLLSEQIYTQQECESRAMQIMQVLDVEVKCGEVIREI